jgi:ankyrin repeat protein
MIRVSIFSFPSDTLAYGSLIGFGETTSLMDAVLTSSEEVLKRCLQNSPAVLERNFLGQSALHHAILHPKHLRQLIPHYETVDVPDKWGTTPLMYAATYDKVESVLLLLGAGADPSRRDELRRRNFLDYALAHGNWDLTTGVVDYLKHHYVSASQPVLNYIMHQFVNSWKNKMGSSRVQELLCMGADPNMNLNDGATLLHRARDFDVARALFDAGFTLINHPDERGITPLMRVVKLGNAALVQACIDRGASVNQQDHRGWSALHHVAKELQTSTYVPSHRSADWRLVRHSELITTVKILLQQGANPAAADHCLCPCSLSGCTASTILLGAHLYPTFPGEGDKWSLEWLQIVSELASDSAGEQTLQDLVRVKQFKEHDLIHVCCLKSIYSGVKDDDINEILDEQSHGIQELEDDDINEILDEQSHGIQELEEMMERYFEGRRGDLEERWIEQLARSHVIRGGDRAFTNVSHVAFYSIPCFLPLMDERTCETQTTGSPNRGTHMKSTRAKTVSGKSSDRHRLDIFRNKSTCRTTSSG